MATVNIGGYDVEMPETTQGGISAQGMTGYLQRRAEHGNYEPGEDITSYFKSAGLNYSQPGQTPTAPPGTTQPGSTGLGDTLGGAGVATSKLPGMESNLAAQEAAIKAEEENRLKQARDMLGGQWDEKIGKQRIRGDKEVGGTEANLAISRGLGASSSRMQFISDQKRENERLIKEMSTARDASLLSLDFAAADRENTRINQLRDYNFKLRQQSFNESQKILENSKAQEDSSPQDIQQYEYYKTQEEGMGKKPLSYMEWTQKLGGKTESTPEAIKMYEYYEEQEAEAGRTPKSFDEWSAETGADTSMTEYQQEQMALSWAKYGLDVDKFNDKDDEDKISDVQVMKQLDTIDVALKGANEFYKASGRSGIRKAVGNVLWGATDYTNLVTQSNTIRSSLLTLQVDPGVKKFFGPQMTEKDVELMTATGTMLNPELQGPEEYKAELDRIVELMTRMREAVVEGVNNSGGDGSGEYDPLQGVNLEEGFDTFLEGATA